MKLKTLIMTGAVIVGSGALLGCGHDNSQTNKPDPYADARRLERVLDCLNMQMAAQSSYMTAVTLEMKATEKGDTNMAAYWHSNSVVFAQMEHEAYKKLKSQ
jgi:hypothetical protein